MISILRTGEVALGNNNYIDNLIASFFDMEKDDKIIFIKHYDSLNISFERLEPLMEKELREHVIYHSFSKSIIQSPYEPFLDAIKYYYDKFYTDRYSIREFVDFCDVYMLHRDVFCGYLSDGKTGRNEPIIQSEVAYEKKKFIESIIKCLDKISKEYEVLFVLNRLQFASYGTLSLLKMILDTIDNLNIKILVVYNELRNPAFYKEEIFKKVIGCAEDNSLLFECDCDEVADSTENMASFRPQKVDFRDHLLRLNNLYNTLALSDAEYYMKIIYDKIVGEKFNISDEEKFYLYVLRAMNCVMMDNINTALYMCENLSELFDREKELKKNYIYNYVNGQAQMMMVQSGLAAKYAKKCKKIAEKIGDEKLVFDAKVLEHSALYNGWKDVFSVDFQSVSIDDEMIEQLKKYKYYNTLAYYYAYGKDNTDEEIQAIIEGKKEEGYVMAQKIAKYTGNMNSLLSIYTKYIVMFTDKGYHKHVNMFYEEKFKIHKMENDERRMANLLLGMGYNAIISEQPNSANEYFNRSIRKLYELRLPEVIAEALYNMTINSICEMDYASACDYLVTIFKMLDNLGLETIQICNTSKLYGLLALCYLKLNNEYRCYTCISKIEILLGHLFDSDSEQELYYWHEDLFLYYFVKGLLEENNGNIDEAYRCLKRAKIHFEGYPGAKFYNVVNFTTEYSKILRIVGEDERADEVIEDALAFCESNGYTEKASIIKKIVNNEKIVVSKTITDSSFITLKEMISLSYNVGKELEVEARKKDVNFLSSWQEMLNRDDYDSKSLVENAVATLQNNFNFDGMLFVVKRDDGSTETLYKDDKVEVCGDYEKVFRFFEVSNREFLANRTNKSFLEYDKIISLFDKENIITMVGVPIIEENQVKGFFIAFVNIHKNFRRNRILINDENLVIIKTAIIQLRNGIERIRNKESIQKINKKLNELAITDMLTGLYNRQGLSKMIESSVNEGSKVTIMYMDLDNFKYYNDTFGHEIGDLILVNFAKVFTKVTKDFGRVKRYGGDEFVILLNDVDSEKVLELSDKIYDAISDGFVNELRERVGKQVVIPDDKKISCSMGIASASGVSEKDIQEALHKADEALYYNKKNNKGKCMLWERMPGR